MFWALNDKEHPYYHPEESRKFGYITDEMYRKFDRVLGKALKSIDPAIPVLVMSDHGFGPFRREVNINNWLVKEGYLKLSTSDIAEEVSILEYADWPASKAYALGLNGLYLNLKGREKRRLRRRRRRAAPAARGDQGQAGSPRRPQERPEGHLLRLHLRGQLLEELYRPRPGHHPGLRPRLPHQRRLGPGHAQPRDGQGQHGLVVGRPLRRPQESAGLVHRQLQDPETGAGHAGRRPHHFKIFRHRHPGAK